MKKPKIIPAVIDIFKNGCLIFTIITLLGYSLRPILDSEGHPFDLLQIWLVFLFSVVLAATNKILTVKRTHFALRLLLHFAACAVLYFAVIILFGGRISDGTQTMLAMALFFIIYLIFAIVYSSVTAVKKKKKNKKENYESVFR